MKASQCERAEGVDHQAERRRHAGGGNPPQGRDQLGEHIAIWSEPNQTLFDAANLLSFNGRPRRG